MHIHSYTLTDTQSYIHTHSYKHSHIHTNTQFTHTQAHAHSHPFTQHIQSPPYIHSFTHSYRGRRLWDSSSLSSMCEPGVERECVPHPSPVEGPGEVVPRPEGQDGHRRGGAHLQLIETGQDPSHLGEGRVTGVNQSDTRVPA